LHRENPNLLAAINNFTGGHGFDSVIITAATTSNDPIELSAEISRKKGKVIAVGAIKLDIPRDPHFYRKELDLRLSCSYGPGRYDVDYEESGADYPYAYVRWTEQRNMEAFLQLLSMGKVDVKPLISHRYPIGEATNAYDIVMGKIKEPHLGILLEYPENKEKFSSRFNVGQNPVQSVNVGFIGAGSFAQSYLIPNVKRYGASLHTVVTSKGITAKNVGEKFGFNNVSSDPADIFKDDSVNTVFIATPHNSHAEYVIQGLSAGKNVFVEKPLAITSAQLEDIQTAYEKRGGNLMVGFNRRFSPLAAEVKAQFKNTGEPFVINYRVNAGFIDKGHWTQNPSIGGGRIIGEVCHFIDLMQFITGADPQTVYAQCIATGNEKMSAQDNISITITFSNGSVGSVLYAANGDKALPKERIEVFCAGKSAVINDFKSAEIYSGNKKTLINKEGKGHREEVEAFLNAIKTGATMPIGFDSLYLTTQATFKIIDSLTTGLPQHL
jgi:predicted dehydrogenase